MAHFQIFIPSDEQDGFGNAKIEKACKRVGLDGWNKGAQVLPAVSQGPNGSSGIILAWFKPSEPLIGFQPSKQTWEDTGEGYWLGYWNGKEPTEQDLRRPDAQKGEWVQMGDEKWIITTPKTLVRYAEYRNRRVEYVTDDKFNWLVHEIDKRKA